MNRSNGSAAARLLLHRLVRNAPLLGDIEEEVSAGRSYWWHWRQALAAIAVTAGDDIRARPLASVAALIIAVLLQHWLIGYPAAGVLNAVNGVLTPFVPAWFLDYRLHLLWGFAIFWLAYAVMGWAMAVLNRGHETAALGILLLLHGFVALRFAALAFGSSTAFEFSLYLLETTVRHAIQVYALVYGGLRGIAPRT